MARDEEIALWIDERWKAALEAQLKDESLKQHLQNVLDGMCRQLPEQEYERISREIQAEEQAELERQEEGRTYTAYRVVENGEEHLFKVTPGDTFLNVGNLLRRYLRAAEHDGQNFADRFSARQDISPEEYQQMMAQRMESSGKVYGVYDIDFDRQEFSAVDSTYGWQSWRMKDVSVAIYRAFQSASDNDGRRWAKLQSHLKDKTISSPGHLSARDFSFGEEIIQAEHGKLNFYVKTEFDVDAVFGTNVLTDENDDWLNIYANYDVRKDELCDSLELTLCKADGSNENWSYPLNAAEKEALRCKMEEYCQQQMDMSLHGYAQYWHEEEGIQPMMKM